MNEHYDMVIHLLMEGGADPDAKQSSQVRRDSDLQFSFWSSQVCYQTFCSSEVPLSFLQNM
jgi:hypothetical protein